MSPQTSGYVAPLVRRVHMVRVLVAALLQTQSHCLVTDSGSQPQVGRQESSLLGALSTASPETNTAADSARFLVPLGYDKLVIPTLKGTADFIPVDAYISIREVTGVNEKEGILELDAELGIRWTDWEIWRHVQANASLRALLRAGPASIALDPNFLQSIWKPDIFIDELVSVSSVYLLAKQFTVYFHTENVVGTIATHVRQTLRVRCDMDFTFYPADTQKCQINLRSFTYNSDLLVLIWHEWQSVILAQTNDPNYDFQVSDVEPGNNLADLLIGEHHECCNPENFSTLTFTIQVRRNVNSPIVQTFLPSVLLILITWLCYLLSQDMVETRIGISMTTLLTIIAMFASVRSQAPSVSYTMAIDIWMVFCIFLIFLALVLFAIMDWTRRKLEEEGDILPCRSKYRKYSFDVGNSSGASTLARTGAANSAGTSFKSRKDNERLLAYSNRAAFAFFAVVFLAFLATFSFWLLIRSDYYNWDPAAQYNWGDSKGTGGKQLFTTHQVPLMNESGADTIGRARVDELVAAVCSTQRERDGDEPMPTNEGAADSEEEDDDCSISN